MDEEKQRAGPSDYDRKMYDLDLEAMERKSETFHILFGRFDCPACDTGGSVSKFNVEFICEKCGAIFGESEFDIKKYYNPEA